MVVLTFGVSGMKLWYPRAGLQNHFFRNVLTFEVILALMTKMKDIVKYG